MNPGLVFLGLVCLAAVVVAYAYGAMLFKKKRRKSVRNDAPVSDARVKAMLEQVQAGSDAGRRIYRTHYLKTAHWRKFRAEAWTHHGGRCAVCGTSVRLHECNIHHLRYFDADGKSVLFRERYSDVQIVHPGRCHVKADRRRHDQTH